MRLDIMVIVLSILTTNSFWAQELKSFLGQNRKYGFVNEEGKEMVAPKYESTWGFSEGLAPVNLNGKWGCIDQNGVTVIQFDYEAIGGFSGGLSSVLLNGQWGYIDNKGVLVIGSKYESAGSFSEGLAAVKLKNKWGFINTTGKVVIPLKYDAAGGFSEGLASVKMKDKYGFIDQSEKLLIPAKYESVSTFTNGLSAVKLNGKYGYINNAGSVVIPIQYDAPGRFVDGLANAMLNGKYGYIDMTGKEICPFKYDNVKLFDQGLSKVRIGSKYGFVDKSGAEVVSVNYDAIDEFIQGVARVRINDKSGYIDRSGKELVPVVYDQLGAYSTELIVAYQGSRWGGLNAKGDVLIPFIYDEINGFVDGYAEVRRDGKLFLLDKSGREFEIPDIEKPVREYKYKRTVVSGKLKMGLWAENSVDVLIKPVYDNISELGSLYYLAVSTTDNGITMMDLFTRAGKKINLNSYSMINLSEIDKDRVYFKTIPLRGTSLYGRVERDLVISEQIDFSIPLFNHSFENFAISMPHAAFEVNEESRKTVSSEDPSIYISSFIPEKSEDPRNVAYNVIAIRIFGKGIPLVSEDGAYCFSGYTAKDGKLNSYYALKTIIKSDKVYLLHLSSRDLSINRCLVDDIMNSFH